MVKSRKKSCEPSATSTTTRNTSESTSADTKSDNTGQTSTDNCPQTTSDNTDKSCFKEYYETTSENCDNSSKESLIKEKHDLYLNNLSKNFEKILEKYCEECSSEYNSDDCSETTEDTCTKTSEKNSGKSFCKSFENIFKKFGSRKNPSEKCSESSAQNRRTSTNKSTMSSGRDKEESTSSGSVEPKKFCQKLPPNASDIPQNTFYQLVDINRRPTCYTNNVCYPPLPNPPCFPRCLPCNPCTPCSPCDPCYTCPPSHRCNPCLPNSPCNPSSCSTSCCTSCQPCMMNRPCNNSPQPSPCNSANRSVAFETMRNKCLEDFKENIRKDTGTCKKNKPCLQSKPPPETLKTPSKQEIEEDMDKLSIKESNINNGMGEDENCSDSPKEDKCEGKDKDMKEQKKSKCCGLFGKKKENKKLPDKKRACKCSKNNCSKCSSQKQNESAELNKFYDPILEDQPKENCNNNNKNKNISEKTPKPLKKKKNDSGIGACFLDSNNQCPKLKIRKDILLSRANYPRSKDFRKNKNSLSSRNHCKRGSILSRHQRTCPKKNSIQSSDDFNSKRLPSKNDEILPSLNNPISTSSDALPTNIYTSTTQSDTKDCSRTINSNSDMAFIKDGMDSLSLMNKSCTNPIEQTSSKTSPSDSSTPPVSSGLAVTPNNKSLSSTNSDSQTPTLRDCTNSSSSKKIFPKYYALSSIAKDLKATISGNKRTKSTSSQSKLCMLNEYAHLIEPDVSNPSLNSKHAPTTPSDIRPCTKKSDKGSNNQNTKVASWIESLSTMHSYTKISSNINSILPNVSKSDLKKGTYPQTTFSEPQHHREHTTNNTEFLELEQYKRHSSAVSTFSESEFSHGNSLILREDENCYKNAPIRSTFSVPERSLRYGTREPTFIDLKHIQAKIPTYSQTNNDGYSIFSSHKQQQRNMKTSSVLSEPSQTQACSYFPNDYSNNNSIHSIYNIKSLPSTISEPKTTPKYSFFKLLHPPSNDKTQSKYFKKIVFPENGSTHSNSFIYKDLHHSSQTNTTSTSESTNLEIYRGSSEPRTNARNYFSQPISSRSRNSPSNGLAYSTLSDLRNAKRNISTHSDFSDSKKSRINDYIDSISSSGTLTNNKICDSAAMNSKRKFASPLIRNIGHQQPTCFSSKTRFLDNTAKNMNQLLHDKVYIKDNLQMNNVPPIQILKNANIYNSCPRLKGVISLKGVSSQNVTQPCSNRKSIKTCSMTSTRLIEKNRALSSNDSCRQNILKCCSSSNSNSLGNNKLVTKISLHQPNRPICIPNENSIKRSLINDKQFLHKIAKSLIKEMDD